MAALPPTVTQRRGTSEIVNDFFHPERPATRSATISDSNPSKNRLTHFAFGRLLGLSVAESELPFVPSIGTRHDAARSGRLIVCSSVFAISSRRCDRPDVR